VVARLGITRTIPARGPVARAYRGRVDAVIVNSRQVRDAFARGAPWFDPAAVHVVMNGIRPPSAPPAVLRARLRAELGAGAGERLVGGVGHVARRKGFDLLPRAFAAAQLPGARLVVAGGGAGLGELRGLADALGIGARVHWLGHRDDGPEVVAGLDVFVLPSRSEGMANVMLEAMAAGVPVIATDISGVRSALGAEDGGPPAGWIVPVDDEGAMAAALREVAAGLSSADGAVAERTAEALRRIRERFGVERMVEACERVLFGPCT
ncbi:MAG TPA: glycosyltransferase, partial [Longimicrobium sp.]|nr:glycosyltransferase [Longimicrobium sp.]